MQLQPGLFDRRASPHATGSRGYTQIHTKPVVRLHGKRAGPARRDPASRHPGSRLGGPEKAHIRPSKKNY